MKTKTVRISSQFPASTDAVWKMLQHLKTLQYIAFPYATFKPIGQTKMKWLEGETSRFYLKLFGIIPMGIHTIKVVQCNKDTLTIYTNEHNKQVPIWNHKIMLQKNSNGTCHYTDEVEIFAGFKTPLVSWWSKLFYRHRQQRWLYLLRTK